MPEGFKISVAEPSDQQSPLVRFSAVLKEWKQDIREPSETNPRQSLGIKFDFIDVTVIESTEPYNFPVASVRIPYSDRAGTAWAEFTKSLRAIVPMADMAAMNEPLDVMVGKQQEWNYANVRLRRPGREGDPDANEWKLRDAKAWTIVSLEGYGSAGGAGDVMDALLDFIGKEGKKDAVIYQWLYTDQSLKQMSGFTQAVEAVGERTLLPNLVAAGKLKAEGDLYKVG